MLKFEDLSIFDLDLIRSGALSLLTETSINDRFRALADATLSCIKAKGYNITNEPKMKFILQEIAPPQGVNPSSNEIIQKIFSILTIEKDETREPTWSSPKKSWYIPHDNRKKPWMF